MKHPLLLPLALAATCFAMSGLSAGVLAEPPMEPEEKEIAVLIGDLTRDQIEEALPDWVMAESDSTPDPDSSRSLAQVERGAEVTVFLGTWCGDSRREVPRLWRALDLAGPVAPFELHYIGVDEAKQEPGGRVKTSDVLFVPTFIVHRGGREVGRIVEHAPGGVEKDLLALLTGQAHGLITSRTDLKPPGSSR